MEGPTAGSRTVRNYRLAAAMVLLASTMACQSPDAVHCAAARVCAGGTVCDEAHDRCVLPEQLSACTAADDDSFCSYPGTAEGTCIDEVCLPRQCGDGRADPGEACDDGNRVGGDGCASDCRSTEQCGNGQVDLLVGETCDDGNTIATDGCGPTCLVESCGNGHLDPGEVCDDGNAVSGDGCAAGCASDERCGNGIVDGLAGEQCDDGNLASRDGCSSGCTGELLTWTEHRNHWSSRAASAAAYDQARSTLVLFGGRSFPDITDDTWTQTGELWELLAPATAPAPRRNHAMAFDSTRQRTVLFGGASGWVGYIMFADTWEFNGQSWIEQSPPQSPPARTGHVMAFDQVRNRVLLFGGADATGVSFGDTWEFDGSTWIQLFTPVSPPARTHAAMVYDASRGRAVLFGGIDEYGFPWGDTWEFDSSTATWTEILPDYEPPWRSSHAMAYDQARQQVVMFGGVWIDGYPLGDTWSYDGATGQWSELVSDYAPEPRSSVAFTYDPVAHRSVLIGGEAAVGGGILEYNDIWYLDGTTWRLAPELWPEPRVATALVYVPSRGRTLMYGGYRGYFPATADTWEFDGDRWWHVAAAEQSPPGRGAHGMTYDSEADRVVLYGGRVGLWEATSLQDTWTFRDGHWQELLTTTSPPPRSNAPLAYDPDGGRVVLFGGELGSSGVARGDTWILADNQWEQLVPETAPPVRASQLLAYDAKRHRLVMAGGRGVDTLHVHSDCWELIARNWEGCAETSLPMMGSRGSYAPYLGGIAVFGGGNNEQLATDTRVYDGVGWSSLPIAGAPPSERMWPGIAWDPLRRQLVVFGGWHVGADYGLPDTWTLRYESDWPDEQCDNSSDDDHDGLVSCEDPDCQEAPGCA